MHHGVCFVLIVCVSVMLHRFYCYVFRCANKGKAYTLALTISKAFYLAYQVLCVAMGETLNFS